MQESFGKKQQSLIFIVEKALKKSNLGYLSMKEGSLFVFVLMRSRELGCFRLCSWCVWKGLKEEGCIGLVSWCFDLGCKSS
jgi:hypothetical protein